MKADKQSKIDRRNKKRGIDKPVYEKEVDLDKIVKVHKVVENVLEKQPIEKIVEEYKAEEKPEVSSKDESAEPEVHQKPDVSSKDESAEPEVLQKKPKRKYNKKSKSS
jgi:hypothetical protein